MAVLNRRNVAYGLSQPLIDQYPLPIISLRAPAAGDKAPLGSMWVDVPNNDAYIITSIVANVATWINIGGGAGVFGSLTVNPGPIDFTGTFTQLGIVNFNVSGAAAMNFGTGTYAGVITIGNVGNANSVSILSPNIDINGPAAGSIDIGASLTTGTIAIGGTAQSGDLTLGSSSAAQNVFIANGAGASAVQIADNQAGGSVSVGNAMVAGVIDIGGTAQTGTITLGSSSAAQTVLIANGAGAVTLDMANGVGANNVRIASGINTGAQSVNILNGANAANATFNLLNGVPSAGAQIVNIVGANNTRAAQLNIATGVAGHSVNIGNAAAAANITLTAGSNAGVVIDSTGLLAVKQSANSITSPAVSVVMNKNFGTVQCIGFTTAAAATQTLTITNALVSAASGLIVSVDNFGANDAQMTITRVTKGVGTFDVLVTNNGSQALNGDMDISFIVMLP